MAEILRKRTTIVVCVMLAVLTLAVFGQTLGHDFIRLDDDVYITLNKEILQYGLSRATIEWAFRTTYNANWHPLTWISYLVDVELFEFNPWGYHLTNVLLHLANVLLVFLVLSRMTGAVWKSAFVSALFAIHPLHIESVAWVAERKDVLSTFFWLLAMWAYVRYVERTTMWRQALLWGTFILGLLAKPMLVTFPFVLLLLDYWPMRRLRPDAEKKQDRITAADLFWEKLPLFGFVVASCFVTFQAQKASGAVGAMNSFPLVMRMGNALVSYIAYLVKTVVPTRLSVYYPHMGPLIPKWQIIGSAILLVAITILVIRAGKKRPYLPVGWFWYVGTMIPVIGLVQVGAQAMADRYTYVPLIGIFIIAAWGIPDLFSRFVRPLSHSAFLPIGAVAVILVLATLAGIHTHRWRDSESLFTYGISVTKYNSVLHQDLGNALRDQGRNEEAIEQYRAALRINPSIASAHHNLAVALYWEGDYEEAWKESYLAASYGMQPDPRFIEALDEEMPDPGPECIK